MVREVICSQAKLLKITPNSSQYIFHSVIIIITIMMLVLCHFPLNDVQGTSQMSAMKFDWRNDSVCCSFRPQGERGSWKSALHSQKALDRANHWQAGEKRKTVLELQEAKFLGNSNKEAGGGDFPVSMCLVLPPGQQLSAGHRSGLPLFRS